MEEEEGQRASERAATAPDPDDDRKPDSPTDLKKPSWLYILRKVLREYGADQCTDLAATLTYYGTLAVFPAMLAFVSILGLFTNPRKVSTTLLQLLQGVLPSSTLDAVRGAIENLVQTPAAGVGLVIGIVGALWSASGYVGAFARAMNRIYNVQEGRPVWKLRPTTLLVTTIAIVAAVVAAVLIAVSGPVARQLGDLIGLGEGAVLAWNIVKWPILVAIAIVVLAVLYYATPNVKQPKFRWMSLGSLVALIVLGVASTGFAFYAANFTHYNATYGAIGGVIVFLLWFWIANNALLFGAELDAELERGRELQAGMAAEEEIQLPPRDTKQGDKKAEQHAKDVRLGRRLRRNAERAQRTSSSRKDR